MGNFYHQTIIIRRRKIKMPVRICVEQGPDADFFLADFNTDDSSE